METIFDWVTVALFAGLIILFLQRSAAEEPSDKLYHYAPPVLGCAVVNYLGNSGYAAIAVVGILAILMYVWYMLKPLNG